MKSNKTTASPSSNPEEIFATAVGFHATSELLYTNTRDISVQMQQSVQDEKMLKVKLGASVERLIVPANVLSAFALELYLKCLLLIESNGVWEPKFKTHEIHKLYQLLSPHMQKRLSDMHNDYVSKSRLHAHLMKTGARKKPYDLDVVLVDANKAFEEWRYKFEQSTILNDFMIGSVLMSARSIILQDHPSWKIHDM